MESLVSSQKQSRGGQHSKAAPPISRGSSPAALGTWGSDNSAKHPVTQDQVRVCGALMPHQERQPGTVPPSQRKPKGPICTPGAAPDPRHLSWWETREILASDLHSNLRNSSSRRCSCTALPPPHHIFLRNSRTARTSLVQTCHFSDFQTEDHGPKAMRLISAAEPGPEPRGFRLPAGHCFSKPRMLPLHQHWLLL